MCMFSNYRTLGIYNFWPSALFSRERGRERARAQPQIALSAPVLYIEVLYFPRFGEASLR